MKRLALYIDGFNFYHAVHDLNRPHLKWINLYRLAERLAYPDERVVSVKYFSAFATWLPAQHARHRQYVAALEACGVEAIMAHFKEKVIQCNGCHKQWISREEKETDVHLALKLLADAEDDLFDRAILLTADSDLVPVIKMVKARHRGKFITVAAPPQRYNHGRHLKVVADNYFQIGVSKIEQSLLPKEVLKEGTVVARRPSEYDPPP